MDPAAFKVFLARLAGAAAEASSADSGSTANNPWADNDQAIALVQGYLDRMKLDCSTDKTGEYPVVNFSVKMTNATHRVRIVVDGKRSRLHFPQRYLIRNPTATNCRPSCNG